LHEYFFQKIIAWEYALASNWARAHPLEVLGKDRTTVGEMVPHQESAFRLELLAQLDRAAHTGRIDVLINSAELRRSIGGGSERASCEAMQAECKPGDRILLGRSNGADMTVRYLLPRAN
jgi:hypothetical protein